MEEVQDCTLPLDMDEAMIDQKYNHLMKEITNGFFAMSIFIYLDYFTMNLYRMMSLTKQCI